MAIVTVAFERAAVVGTVAFVAFAVEQILGWKFDYASFESAVFDFVEDNKCYFLLECTALPSRASLGA